MLRLLLTVVATVLAAATGVAADEQDCFQAQEPQVRIKACSELIERSPEDATAYHNRAFAHALAGDVDSAIADYSKVIAIAPSTASAYTNRGRAYASRGDYTHAVEDETKAHELIAKATAQPVVSPPKAAKAPKKKAAPLAKAAAAQPKEKAIPSTNSSVAQEPPTSSWWSWLWGSGADANPPAGKNAKP
jgi:tetratricopeptide (TPR) repeat protein